MIEIIEKMIERRAKNATFHLLLQTLVRLANYTINILIVYNVNTGSQASISLPLEGRPTIVESDARAEPNEMH